MNRRVITKDELDVFLRKHKLWLQDDPEGERADLSEANLYKANLYKANLYKANLSGAYLYKANLYKANLYKANLSGAYLYKADLYKANLYKANLSGAYLYKADLSGAYLYKADNINYPIACPEKGSFTAFKKAGKYIVELLIPEDSLRSSATARKCRCSKATVVSITHLDGSATELTSVHSSYDSNFIYTIGATVSVDNFDPNRWNECAPGIHFFITRQEAVDYVLTYGFSRIRNK